MPAATSTESALQRIDDIAEAMLATGVGLTRTGEERPIGDFAVSRGTYRILETAAASAPRGASVEIGCASGLSTLAICRGRIKAGFADEPVHVIDPGQARGYGEMGWHTIDRAGLGAMVSTHDAFDYESLPMLLAQGLRAGFIFIDGKHLFDYVVLDLLYADKLLVEGGVVVLHDLWMPAIQHAAAYWVTNLPYEAVSVEGDGLVARPHGREPDGAGDPSLWSGVFRERLAGYVDRHTLVLRKRGLDPRTWKEFAAFV